MTGVIKANEIITNFLQFVRKFHALNTPMYNHFMDGFRYFYDIQVRFADFDTQWHVNHARLLTFLEQARFSYMTDLGIFSSREFIHFPFILADIHAEYKAPVTLAEPIRVWVRVGYISKKSLKMHYVIENHATREVKVLAETVMVAYDNIALKSIPISDEWRQIIETFEGKRLPKPAQ